MQGVKMLNEDTQRRLGIYVPRVSRMLTGRKLKALCWYMHIPKSGGSSIHEALRAVIPLNQRASVISAVPMRRVAGVVYAGTDDTMTVHEDGPRCAELFKLREYHQMTYMAQEDALIYGHCLYSETAHQYFGTPYKYITMLRDPISRVISNYRSATFEKFYTGDFNAYLGSDVARRHALLNLRYFSGIAEIERGQEDTAMEKAKINQDTFSVIGFLDNIEQFKAQFYEVFGAHLKIPHFNSAKGNKVDLTSDQRTKLDKLCEYDLELHERAKKKFLNI